ncbi:hypothetical protein WMY93_021283 [Mugilogobius chulae]|uniref:HMA domain-containing protein n=1 Tax=Mugilogobius chulae TaxID=88201 RepID=A0AAW0NAA3_9GOBI
MSDLEGRSRRNNVRTWIFSVEQSLESSGPTERWVHATTRCTPPLHRHSLSEAHNKGEGSSGGLEKADTPLTKMRIHFDTGAVTFSDPSAAAAELEKRGFSVGPVRVRKSVGTTRKPWPSSCHGAQRGHAASAPTTRRA